MQGNKGWGKDFILMVIGQIISLFGNSILRFVLSLYVLDTTHSATIFGGILAISMIPSVVLSPIGGILSDRINRRNIMVGLDFITSALILGFAVLLKVSHPILLIGTVMIILGCIQAFYQPSVQASIPSLVDEEHLMAANGMVAQVSALASLFGPIVGGFLYAFVDMTWILVISTVCFFISAVMECFIKIPFVKKDRTQGILQMVIGDIKEAIHFLKDEQPILFKMLFIIAALNLFLSALLAVGLPYILNETLQLGSQYYGFAQAALAIGSIAGAILAGIVSKKVSMNKSYVFLFVACMGILPIAIGSYLTEIPIVAYVFIIIGELVCIMFATLFNVFGQTFVQTRTPNALMGKIMAFVMAIATCAYPLGQAMYGVLFDVLKNQVWLVILIGAVLSLLVSVAAQMNLRKLKESGATI
ncbi:MFS transporter [Cellulosilyticum lentocellum]|uniref:Major facilitator superfamily MFS_1 n=1 Tax=Cellulosilyticum lentocellum (strain ATCC 49066 / DSM 5427 / NCIMB 11756 / RHM5) TaxID=642492 RepID=F2JJQ3_CELLD|nr:MFS transporter [Cellulosilyticum lentocellum]ADZ82095.1 major facilitator superfamily MFS_1 [Cellulosilyticum lentocellum DSM 5427]